MSDERRTSPRLAAYLPGELDTGQERATVAITRDVSAGGLLVYSRMRLDAGVSVKIRVAHEGKVLLIGGKVLRDEPLPIGESQVWRVKMAIAAEPGDTALAELYTALAKTAPPSE